MSVVSKEDDEFKEQSIYSVSVSPSSGCLDINLFNLTDWIFTVTKEKGEVKVIGVIGNFSGRGESWVGPKSEMIFITDEGKVELEGRRADTDVDVNTRKTSSGKIKSSTTVREKVKFPMTKDDFKKICYSDDLKVKVYGKRDRNEFNFSDKDKNKIKALYNQAIDSSKFGDIKEELESGGCIWYLKIIGWIILAIIIFSIIF